ncbi:Protein DETOXIFICATION 16 [Zea mays]|jgi:multidrug resistance protein, MATE family|uniref:Protein DETOXIFICATION 16 n=1 Tax=Zea mays TaxID=4577 RepID=A0A3L6DCD2_MAIZE|nr:Protein DETOXIFICATION 16 [Zea mays]
MAKKLVEEALLAAADEHEEENLSVREELKKQLWLAGPMIAGALLQNVIQMISVMYVGHLGELPLAGASMANSFATVTGLSLLVSNHTPAPLLTSLPFHALNDLFCLCILVLVARLM